MAIPASFLIKFLESFLILYAVYQICSIAALFSESSGVANIAVEGNMVLSAGLFSIIWFYLKDSIGSQELEIAISIICASILSAIYMSILSLLTTKYLADHIIVGTGMNLMAPAIAIFMFHWTVSASQSSIITSFEHWQNIIEVDSKQYTFQMLFVGFVIISILIVIISIYILNKTKFGLRLKASGENPYSLETSGVSVAKTRFIALIIAGLLSGLAGAMFATKDTFYFTVNGSGFLSLGILILGQYKVIGTFIGSLVFAILISIFSNLSFWIQLGEIETLLKTIPFIIPIIGLIIFRKHHQPKAIGQNFKKDQR